MCGRSSIRLAALAAGMLLAAAAVPAPLRAQGEPPAVTILQFVDYASPASQDVQRMLSRLREDYRQQVRVVVRHFPATPQARLSHLAALAADQHGRFDELHAILADSDSDHSRAAVLSAGKQAGLDPDALERELDSVPLENRLAQDIAEAQALGLRSSPTLILKGRVFSGALDEPAIRRVIDTALGKTLVDTPVALDLTGAPRLGPAGAPEITVFSDFQCPYCAMLVPVLKQLVDSGEAAVRFKHYPLSFHTKAPLAHRAAVAAGEQGKFWEMHDRIFADQKRLERDAFLGYAKDLGLDPARFAADLARVDLDEAVKRDRADGDRLPVSGTPTVLVNGRLHLGANSLDALRAALRSAGARPSAPVTMTIPELSLYGPKDAATTIEWFFDARSELTPAAAGQVRAFIATSPANVQVIGRHLPLPFHPESPLVHEALSLAAGEGKFWEYLQVLQRSPGVPDTEGLKSIATRVGLNVVTFSQQLDERARKAEVERDLALARSRNIRGVPTFALNGTVIDSLPAPR